MISRAALSLPCRHIQRRIPIATPKSLNVSTRLLATQATHPSPKKKKGQRPKQPFVKERFEPGEWDLERTDPIDRPTFKSKAKVLSREEFLNRPRVGFGTEFASLHDAGTVLSWLPRNKWDEIFDAYLELMEGMRKETNGVTSHEYAMMVLSKKFHIRKTFVSAVVELCHREERLKETEGEDALFNDVQEKMDREFQDHIDAAYAQNDETPPDQFTDSPRTPMNPLETSPTFVAADELHDLSDMMAKAARRERDEAQLLLDNKVYNEDVDDGTRYVRIDQHCSKMMKIQQKHQTMATRDKEMKPLPAPVGDRAPKHRKKFKFAAKIIDTRKEKELRKIKGKYMRKKKIRASDNMLIEEDGVLRAATVHEANCVSWKAPRDNQEFIMKGVKAAWIERLKGKKDGWGRAKVTDSKND